MTENDPREDSTHPLPPPNDQPEAIPVARPLDYGRPGAKRGGVPIPARWAIGCSGYLVLSFLWFAGAAALQSGGAGKNQAFWAAFDGWVAMTIGLLGLTLWLRSRFGYKGYGYGVLTGIPIAIALGILLIIGVILLVLAQCGYKF